jgi:hypothetical protein
MPILKWKTGERIALRELKKCKSNLIPVIELVDDYSPEEFFSELDQYYDGPIYYDTVRCDDDGRNLLQQYVEYAKDKQLSAWPLIYYNDLLNLKSELDSSRYAVKIPVIEDMEGPSTDEILSHIVQIIDSKLVDIFFDAGEVKDAQSARMIYTAYKDLFTNNHRQLTTFKHIVICLTSFPEQLAVDSGDTAIYERFDWKIFSKLIKIFSGKDNYNNLAFSDYGVTKFTDTEMDFRLLRYGILPKVKYTTNDNYIVHKGKKNRLRDTYIRSYIDISKDIIRSEYYFGEDFSYGDAFIYEKATIENPKPGSSTNWVACCANHHLTVVIEQLSNLLVS